MADPTDARIDAALERGHLAQMCEPRAEAARYDAPRERIVVGLKNGCVFEFLPHLVQGLEDATGTQLAGVEILGGGYSLHWEALDVDLSVPGLLSGLFGTRAHMARLAGRSKSGAKAAAG